MVGLPAAIDRLNRAARIVITTHQRSDGDALGSVAAMQRVLRARGKQATAYLHEQIPERYRFMSDIEPLAVWGPDAPKIVADADLLLVLDTCAAVQLGPMAEAIRAAKLPKLAIDHHLTRDDIVDEAHVDVSAAACTQILTKLFDQAGWPIDASTATHLYVGLATDTGWFRFSNAGSAAYATAARLIHAGVRPNELYERLFLCEFPARARLIGAIMSSFELLCDDRLAVIKLTNAMLKASGANRSMTEDIINEPMRIASVVACAMLVEPEGDDPVRISLRSKRDLDVAALAAKWGGGGHARAAGAKIKGAFNPVCDDVVRALTAEMDAMK
ncbi:MAG TPA: DHH family phosphoesterase [Phycisphaerae bacterium]|nr:DHH family phosphoesterase [Phycisphaerae bacterium]